MVERFPRNKNHQAVRHHGFMAWCGLFLGWGVVSKRLDHGS